MKIPYKEILKTIAVFVVGFGIILLVAKTTNKIIGPSILNNSERQLVECPLDTESYQATKSKNNVVILENKTSRGENGSFTGNDYNVSIKRTGLKSQVACGYLFYKVSVGSNPIDIKSEGLYMAPTKSIQFGGHILPTEANSISIKNVDNKTEVLMPLNSISYDGTARINIKEANWVSLLNVTSQIDFNIALNTIRDQGKIDSVEIAYKCWNPQTGQETDDCKLEVVK